MQCLTNVRDVLFCLGFKWIPLVLNRLTVRLQMTKGKPSKQVEQPHVDTEFQVCVGEQSGLEQIHTVTFVAVNTKTIKSLTAQSPNTYIECDGVSWRALSRLVQGSPPTKQPLAHCW